MLNRIYLWPLYVYYKKLSCLTEHVNIQCMSNLISCLPLTYLSSPTSGALFQPDGVVNKEIVSSYCKLPVFVYVTDLISVGFWHNAPKLILNSKVFFITIKCGKNSIKSIDNINLIEACLNIYLWHVCLSVILKLDHQMEVASNRYQ